MSFHDGGDTVLVVKHVFVVTAKMSNETVMPYEETELHCERGDLLGPLGLFVQGLLAFIAFASLIGELFNKALILVLYHVLSRSPPPHHESSLVLVKLSPTKRHDSRLMTLHDLFS